MSLQCVRECADKARLSDCVQQYRTTRLTIRVHQYTGERIGSINSSKELVSELVMPKYEVRELSAREVLASGGEYKRGDVVVKDISPPYEKTDGTGQGGYTLAQLDPKSTWGQPAYNTPVRNRIVEYVLEGETAGIFSLVNVNTDNVTAWSLVLSNTRKSP